MAAGAITLLAASALLLGACGPPLFEQGIRPLREVAPPPGGSLSASACASCHERETAAWRRSRHAVAHTNAIFQVSWRMLRMRWCNQCHSPLPEQQAELAAAAARDSQRLPANALAREGVNCAVCHLRRGEILAAKPPTAAGVRAHPMRHEPLLSRAEFCAGCHEFTFPHRPQWPVRPSSFPLQHTSGEWKTTPSAARGETCQRCHMPGGAHTFPGAHDPTLLRDSLAVRVVARAGRKVELEMESVGVAHGLPTGDPFRRLEVRLCAEPDCTRPLARRTLGRIVRPAGTTFRIVADTTIPPPSAARPGERPTRRVSLTARAGEPATHWQVRYYFGEARLEEELRPHDISTVVATGPLPAP